MTTRILPPDEWTKLAQTEAGPVWPHLDPERAQIIVVEECGAIVGTWVLMTVVHAECLWIAPAYRQHASVGRRLWTMMRNTAQSMGVPVVATAAMTDDVRALLDHVGAEKLPGDHYALKVN